MEGNHESEAGDEMLRAFLRGQRESVLAIVEGLDEEAWHRSVVPTGWTPTSARSPRRYRGQPRFRRDLWASTGSVDS
ncbi:MAG: hypothetical protein ACHQ4F_14990, partial [Candidatus Dormibacteria bacterium]